MQQGLDELVAGGEGRGFELVQGASGYRFQVRQDLAEWVSRLWEEKPGKYSRAFLETLSLIAYKQPVTRGDIELVRGVAVSQNIIRTLTERGWIRVVGTRDVPGRPALYGTPREFLDYFNLRSLDELPPLAEIRSLLEQDDPDDPIVTHGVVVEGTVTVELELPQADERADERNGESPASAATAEDTVQEAAPDVADGAPMAGDGEPAGEVPANNVIRLPTAHG